MPTNLPYFITDHFEIKAKTLLSSSIFLKGWYIVNLLFSLASNQMFDYLEQNNVKLETKDMIQSGWYRIYLNEEQISFLLKNNLASLYPIIREKTTLSESDLYLVYASPDFHPPTSDYQQIDENLFVLSNISSIRKDPKVLKIKPHSRPMLENRYAGGYSENLNEIPSYDEQNRFLIPRPLHQIGLTGRDQVIAISDSGLDTYHCLFYDPNVKTPFRVRDFNHRKIVLYDPVADDLEAERGHGTHVCGIVAGEAGCTDCGLSQYNGVAPGAKIYMHDLGDLRNGGGSIIDINLPYYIERMRYASSFISSNSWGYSSGFEEIRATFSRFAFENPDLLFLFACGNSYSSYTIHVPSNSKNVLAVGALTSPYGALFEKSSDSIMFPSDGIKKYKTVILHNSGPSISDCLRSDHSIPFNNKEVLLINSYNKREIIDAQRSVVIIENDDNDQVSCEFAMSQVKNASLFIFTKKLSSTCKKTDESTVTVPIYYMANSSIDRLFLQSLKKVTVQPHYRGKRESVTRLGLSSQGPSSLGYTKPEIVATGQNILSACAGSTYNRTPRACSTATTVTKSGTSMSTPVAAGVLLIVRQFFVEGWYPSCNKPDENLSYDAIPLGLLIKNDGKLNVAFVPSSSLLRAFAVNSAKKIGSLIETGFGAMNPYEAFGFTGVGLRVINHFFINSGEHYFFNLFVKNSKSTLSVTLSYLDPPLPVSSSMPLFADLDLVVISPSGKVYKGNGFENNLDEDQFATTEKVIINKAEKGNYTVHIISSRFPMPQKIPYSIVISGNFDQKDFHSNPAFIVPQKTNKCYSKCKYGNCVNGICICNAKYYGHSCNKKATLANLETNEYEMNNKKVRYILFKIVDMKQKNNQSIDIFTIKFNIDNKNGVGYCFNFQAKALKIAEPDQECYFQNESEANFSFNSSVYPSIKPGNYISMSLYSVVKDYNYVDFTISGVEAHFSIVFWFVHLPLWMMITVASSVGLVIILIVVILMLTFCQPAPRKKKSKKKNSIVPQIDDNPNPTVMDHDPNDNISIDENLL